MSLKWNIAYIGVGSNLGDKIKNCVEAIQFIHSHPDCEVLRISSFYETEPLSLKKIETEGWYVNCAIKIRTPLNPVRLLQLMLNLEIRLGREPHHEKWSPRPIDLDLLFFNDDIIKTGPLRVPHPELHKRRFVLEPLAEIEPALVHPIKGSSVEKMLTELTDNKKIVPLFRFYLTRNSSESFGQL
jgi:2-amino-4-hydroxy-6-hydroxymethyldihydropteridine diphosphokinase